MDTSVGYTVRNAYQLLTTQDTPQVEGAAALVWHKHIPLKVSIFAWRLVKNRLPTRANLVHRGILSDAVAGCLCGCGATETSQHLFISCDFYGTLWSQVRSWLGVSLIYRTRSFLSVYSFNRWRTRKMLFHATCVVD